MAKSITIEMFFCTEVYDCDDKNDHRCKTCTMVIFNLRRFDPKNIFKVHDSVGVKINFNV